MSRSQCKHCGYMEVSPVGNKSSSVVVMFDYPDFDDQKTGKLMSGHSGEILQAEFNKAGMSLSSCLITSFSPHIQNKECSLENHQDYLPVTFQGKTKVLLLGSGIVEHLFSRKAIDLSGVWQQHKIFSGIHFMPCISPGSITTYGIGELRIAIERFKERG